jgi:serine-type D-Ala-D-Ala carboxypeptidase (penicillin-binding protein 5/6)
VKRGLARALVALPALLLGLNAAALGVLSPQAVPRPTPVPPNGSPSPFLSKLQIPRDPTPVPEIDARSVLLVDLSLDQVLVQTAAHESMPIASLTKVMTALLVIERERGHLDRSVRVDPDAVFGRGDFGASSSLGLSAGERVSVRGLLGGLLLGSANDAAEALAIEESGSEAGFVEDMNARARELGMRDTRFTSPHGLDDRGLSSSLDLSVLLRAALDEPAFRQIVGRRSVTIRSTRVRRRTIQNRNVMLWLYPGATGVKTGSTSGAGFCRIATARHDGRELAAIVLGGRDEVFSDAAALLNHGFAAYQLRTLVEEGETLGSLAIRGGTVPVVAGEALAVLVREGDEGRIERVLAASRGAAYPAPSGSVVGTIRLRVPGGTLGGVPVLAADVAPPTAPSTPWWARAGGAFVRAVTAAIDGLFG